MVEAVINAPWIGVTVQIRWHKHRCTCREHTCHFVAFIDQNHSVSVSRACPGVRAIRWAIGHLCFEGATIAGLA